MEEETCKPTLEVVRHWVSEGDMLEQREELVQSSRGGHFSDEFEE